MKYLATLLSITLILISGVSRAEQDPIAELYGEAVYSSNLEIPDNMAIDARSRMSDDEFSKWQQNARQQILAFYIMDAARNKFLAAQALEPTQQDIDSFVAYIHRAQQADREKRAEARAEIDARLKRTDLSDAARQAAESNLATLDGFDKQDIIPQNEADQAKQLEEERTVAAMMVPGWAFNQGLYRQYGGKVAIQQTGLEPIDALKSFMQELAKSDAYKILDPAYADVFKDSDAYFDKEFQYVDKETADKYFASPWWLEVLIEEKKP